MFRGLLVNVLNGRCLKLKIYPVTGSEDSFFQQICHACQHSNNSMQRTYKRGALKRKIKEDRETKESMVVQKVSKITFL